MRKSYVFLVVLSLSMSLGAMQKQIVQKFKYSPSMFAGSKDIFNKRYVDTPFIKENFNKKQFHTSAPLVHIKSMDKNVSMEKLAKYAYLFKSKKAPMMYYIDPSKVTIMQNGIGGAQLGWHIGWWGTHVVCHSAIFVGCRIADMFAPGVGAAAEKGLHTAAEPYILMAAKTVACGTAIATATATGPA